MPRMGASISSQRFIVRKNAWKLHVIISLMYQNETVDAWLPFEALCLIDQFADVARDHIILF
uniref:Uncharacterized protein n=1 Tax=Arundo donax TaxID=35708 RepID=A0A0A9HRC6_ARUDO